MKLLSTVLILSMCFSCKGQDKNQKNTFQNTNTMTTEKFNITTFEKNKVDGEYNFVLDDGTKVRQLSTKLDYGEFITPPPPELFITSKQYYKTGELQTVIISLPRSFAKLKKVYTKNGELIEETNFDTPYKFSFEQLLILIEKEEDTIDLFDKNTSITRGVLEEGPIWEITYKKTPMRREDIKIDGITGEILERSFHGHLDN